MIYRVKVTWQKSYRLKQRLSERSQYGVEEEEEEWRKRRSGGRGVVRRRRRRRSGRRMVAWSKGDSAR